MVVRQELQMSLAPDHVTQGNGQGEVDVNSAQSLWVHISNESLSHFDKVTSLFGSISGLFRQFDSGGLHG